MCIIYEVDRKGAEFTGNIHIQSQISLDISVDFLIWVVLH